MDSKRAKSLIDSCRVGLAALAVLAFTLMDVGSAYAQSATADVQLTSANRENSGETSIQARAGDTVVIEYFATGWDGLQGINAVFTFSDVSMFEGEKPDLSPAAPFNVPVPAIIGNEFSTNQVSFTGPGSESGTDLKYMGHISFTLSPTFTSLTVTLDRVVFGGTTLQVGTEIVISDPASAPKTFAADLNGDPGNQGVLQGRANPGGRFGVQTFAGGLNEVEEVEIRVQIDPTQINAEETAFQPAPGWMVQAAAAGSLADTMPSSELAVEVDIQNVGDNTHTPDGLTVTAGGGSTVDLEIFGEHYSGANGLVAEVQVSDPSAVAGVSINPSNMFNLLASASIEGNVISLNGGNLSSPSTSDFARVATLSITLAPNFNGVVLNVTKVEFVNSNGLLAGGNPNATLTVIPTGGIQPSLVQVSGNDVILSLKADTPVSGDVALGRFGFLTRAAFSQTQLTFRQVSFVSGGVPAGIEPNVTVSVRSSLSSAPTVSEPPVPATVTNDRALIRWVTNRAGIGKVIYGTDRTNLDQEATQTGGSSNIHQVELAGLTAGTQYFFQVITTDDANNQSEAFPPQPVFFVTKRRADTLPPRVVRGPAAVGITLTSATILVEFDEVVRLDILYGSSADNLDQIAGNGTEHKLHALKISGLSAGETIFFKARATDLVGNVAETPDAKQFTLRSVADATAPRIVGRPTVLGTTSSTAVLRWRTSEPSSSKVRYGLHDPTNSLEQRIDLLADSVSTSELVNEHTLVLSNLPSDTEHDAQVESVDASGNVVTSPLFIFKTRSGEDTKPPRITRPPVIVRRSDTEALIALQTNEPSTVTIQVDQDVSVASDETGILGDSFSTTEASRKHEVLVTGLEAATVYFYRISVTDISGNGPTYNPGTLSFATLSVPDVSAPVVFSRPVAIGITEDGASINWGADEPHSAVIRYRLDPTLDPNNDFGTTKQAVGAFDEAIEDLEFSRRHAVPISGLQADSYYAYEVETIDAEGNSATTSGLFFKTRSGADTEAPVIVRGPRVTNITASSATVQWGTDEPADTRVSWGTSAAYTESIEEAEGVRFHSTTLTDLEPGTVYHYAVGSADGSGNVVTTDANGTIPGLSVDHTFRTLATEDTQPPVITEGPLAEIRNNLVVLKWRTDELATSRVVAGVLPGSDDANTDPRVFGDATQIVFEEGFLRRNHSVTVTGLSPGLNYVFQVSSTDAAGNTVSGLDPTINPKLQPPGGFGSFTTTTEADTQFPVITSGPTVVASTSSSLTVEWSTDESSNGTVDFGDSSDNLGSQEASTTNNTTHRMVLTKLATGTTYAYQVGSTDASGNGATKSAVLFGTTAAAEDLTAPVISGTPSVIYVNDRQATISWTTSEAADSEVAFGTAADQLLEVRNDDEFNTNHSITLTNLDAGTTYFYTVSSTDQSNNGPATSSVLEFSTEALPDTAPPVTSEISAAPTATEALITWTTDELSDSAVRFGTQSGSLDFNTGDSEDVTDHSVTLTNLTPATTYTFTVESIDRAGNQGTASAEQTFTTLAEGESPTLAAPTALTATAGNGAVILGWTASTSGGVTGVVVERAVDGGSFTAVATLDDVTSFTDNNVVNGTSYSYQLKSVGLNSVQSDASAASDAVTPAAGIGPSTPVLSIKQGNPLQPTFVITNSTPLNDGDVLNYTFQLSSQADFSDALSLDSGLGEGSGLGASDPSGLTAWTVSRELDDGVTYHYRIKSSDGTFDSDFLVGSFTANSADLPYPGDIDGDFSVGFGDFLNFVGTFNLTSDSEGFIAGADLDGSGAVDFGDFLAFVGAFGTQFIRGEDASTKPIAIAATTYGVDAQTRLEMIGRPTSSEAGGELTVEIHAKDVQDLMGAGLRISYDTDALEFVEAYQGNDALLNTNERKAETFATLEHDPAKGELFVAGAITEGGAVSGEGILSRLTFVLKTDHPQGDLISLAEGLIIDGSMNVNAAQHLGARLALVPNDFTLGHNFPNPFNPETTIRYAIPEAAQVRLIVYNVLGQEVTRLVDKDQVPGFYALRWDGRDSFGRGVASGVYLYKIQAIGETQRFSQIHKMLLLK